MRRATLHAILGAGVVAVLAATSTVAIAAAGGGLQHSALQHGDLQHSALPYSGSTERSAPCAAPALAGTVVDVTLVDMGDMMGGASTSNGNLMMGSTGTSSQTGLMRLLATPGTAAAGTISFRVHNVGARTHELVVLPLQPGQAIGQRVVGADGRVDETGSLGEASRSCGGGAGQGIAAGTTSWVTLTLTPGRYELVCNLPGHYTAGMDSALSVR